MTTTIRLLATTNEGSVTTGAYGTGRRVKATTVQLGPLEHTARRTSDAVDVIEARLAEFLAAANGDSRPVIVACDGYVLVSALILTSEGPAWHTETVDPDGRKGGWTQSGYHGRDVHEARMRYQLAQRTVTDWTDTQAVLDAAEWVGGLGKGELLDYAGFQRAWTYAPVDVADRHQWANEHRHEYVPKA